MLVEREAWINAQLEEANKENRELHDDLVSTMKDLGGCKVTIKYMDKEIIGRIQQLQLMQQGLDKPPNTLTWNTIEAEISLNRHKVGALFLLVFQLHIHLVGCHIWYIKYKLLD